MPFLTKFKFIRDQVFKNSISAQLNTKKNPDNIVLCHDNSHHLLKYLFGICVRSKRGIWKVRSTVFYLSYRFTNPIMFGNVLKGYISSMLWHKFHENI